MKLEGARGWPIFKSIILIFDNFQVQCWPEVLNKENDRSIFNESPPNEDAPPLSNASYDHHYIASDRSSPSINTPATNKSSHDDDVQINSFHVPRLTFSPISVHDTSSTSQSLTHSQLLSIDHDMADSPSDDDYSFPKYTALSSKPIPTDTYITCNNSFNDQQSHVSSMSADVSIIQLSAGESPQLFNAVSNNLSLNRQSSSGASSPLNELSLNDTVSASDSISFGGQVEKGKGKGEATESLVEMEEATRVKQKSPVIIVLDDDDSDDERLEQCKDI